MIASPPKATVAPATAISDTSAPRTMVYTNGMTAASVATIGETTVADECFSPLK